MDDMYYVLHCFEPGNVVLHSFSKEKLDAALNAPGWEGIKVYMDDSVTPLAGVNVHATPGLYIFKGMLVAPKQVVTWEI